MTVVAVDGRWPCLTPAELARWKDANAVCHPRTRTRSPCADCTSAYAAAMRRDGRCDGMPRAGGRAGGRPRVQPTEAA